MSEPVSEKDAQNQEGSPSASAAHSRRAARAPIALKVEYHKLNTFFSDYTKNISKGGTFIKTERPLPLGTEFVFRLHIPSRSEAVELRGAVAWINTKARLERPEQADPGMGIQFVYENDAEKKELEDIVEALMKDTLGEHIYRKLLEGPSAGAVEKK